MSATVIQKKIVYMGVLNITPDSFYDGGKYLNLDSALLQTKKLIESGASIIDIGGESTRPDSIRISTTEELNRVLPVIKEVKKQFKNITVSIDTYKSNIAKEALENGAEIINDVSGLNYDPEMVSIIKRFNCKVVIMHNTGIPATKPGENSFNPGIIKEVTDWLEKQINYALENGVKKENIIIDPGIGFGKSALDDLKIIEELNKIKELGYPVLIGHSNKSFIKKLFGENNIESKSREITQLAIKNGTDIIRLHKI